MPGSPIPCEVANGNKIPNAKSIPVAVSFPVFVLIMLLSPFWICYYISTPRLICQANEKRRHLYAASCLNSELLSVLVVLLVLVLIFVLILIVLIVILVVLILIVVLVILVLVVILIVLHFHILLCHSPRMTHIVCELGTINIQ